MNPTIKAKKYVLVVGIASAALFAAMSVFCSFSGRSMACSTVFYTFYHAWLNFNSTLLQTKNRI